MMWRVRHWLRQTTFRVVVVAGCAAIAASWYFAGRTIADVKPVTSPMRPSAIVWGDRVFEAPEPLRAWLRVRGVAYPVWAKRHPHAVRLLHKPTKGR